MSLHIAHNMEDLAEVIGGYLGMADGIQQPVYMDGLITTAFHRADRKFNAESGLVAKKQRFEHMYEYGTTGITDGDAGLSFTRQESRLWKTFTIGKGGRKSILFTFLPAKMPNPKKTTENTNDIPQHILDKLKVNRGTKYVFTRKAEATERNDHIVMSPRDPKSPGLFIPTDQEPAGTTGIEEDRGYAFRKRHISRPGEFTGGGGRFSMHFVGWWTTSGKTTMETSMMEQVNREIRAFAGTLGINPRSLKTPMATNINGTALKKRAKTRKQWELQAVGAASFSGRVDEQGKVS